MPDLRTDAQLATAYLAGDRGALAGIYDRFSAGLYDTAAAMLRDRHEAADAMQDVFLIAAERMGQLREPERLKPWLYAILRNEVYRRTKKRGRQLPTDFSAMGAPELAAPIAPDAEGESVSAAELAELVRSAACGLDERDQLVLELSVRQGLQGADLAAALGVTPDQSYTLVHRMRDRVERSLGALVVARAGRKDCPDLADVLSAAGLPEEALRDALGRWQRREGDDEDFWESFGEGDGEGADPHAQDVRIAVEVSRWSASSTSTVVAPRRARTLVGMGRDATCPPTTRYSAAPAARSSDRTSCWVSSRHAPGANVVSLSGPIRVRTSRTTG